MKPAEYERGVAEWLRVHFPPPAYKVEHNIRLRGLLSDCRRQIDVVVWEDTGKLLCIVEAKMHRRKVALDTAGEAFSIIQDVRASDIVVSSAGFTAAAKRLLAGLSVDWVQVTVEQARAANWIPVLQQIFPIDAQFKMSSGNLLESLRALEIESFLYTDVPFEEWIAVFTVGRKKYPQETAYLLRQILMNHDASGHRYNAFRLLHEMGELDDRIFEHLYITETDQEIIELAEELCGE